MAQSASSQLKRSTRKTKPRTGRGRFNASKFAESHDDPLEWRERIFVEELVAGTPPVDAYRTAFKPGKTAKAVDVFNARQLIKQPHVLDALNAELMEFCRKFHVDRDVALQNIALIALADPLDLIDPDTNTLKPIAKIPVHARRAIQSVQQMADGSIKITLASKDKAAALLAAATGVTGSGVKGEGVGATRVRLAYDKTSGRLAVEFKTKGPIAVEDESSDEES